jgi:hypothetical protein
MTHPNTSRKSLLGLAVAILAVVPLMTAQQYQPPNTTQMQASPAAQGSFCGNRPLCYESGDFAATITQFRTSTDVNGNKLLDAILHFQNKTNQALGLGYVDGSGSGLDDRGNRYALVVAWGGVRGMGVISGNNANPSFVLAPGGSGDARFELVWARPPANAVIGVNYEMELDIREVNRAEGNQWILGNETLMHYQGLVNGVSAPASSYNAAGAGSPGSSYMSSPSGSGSAGSSGSAMPAGSAINNYVPSGVSNYVPSAVNNAIGNTTNGYTQQNGYAQPNTSNGYTAPNGYSVPANGYSAPVNGYAAPANGNTATPVNTTTTTPATQAKPSTAQPAAAKAVVVMHARPAVTKALIIKTLPAAKPSPAIPVAKRPTPPVPPKTTTH